MNIYTGLSVPTQVRGHPYVDPQDDAAPNDGLDDGAPDYVPPAISGEALLATTGVRGILERDPKRITVGDKDRAEMLPRDIRRACRAFLEDDRGPQKSSRVEPFRYDWALDHLTSSQDPQHLVDIADAFRPEDHDLASDYLAVAKRAFAYLQGLLPIRTEETMARAISLDPSDTEIARFRRAFDVANDPMVIFRDMGRSSLIADQIRHLGACYPTIYTLIKTTMATGMADALARKQSWRLSYWRDRQVQVLYATTTWNKQLATDLQKSFAGAAKTPQGPAPAQGTSKAASTLQTSTQATVDGAKA
jgi:hypothetical protein